MNHITQEIRSLVGQTVVFSPKDKKEGGNITRTLTIYQEFHEASRRWYAVKDVATGETFAACADTYDKFFLVKKQSIKSKSFLKETIYSPSHPDYKL